ncbi:hypothetical protein GCM10010429_01420 [Micromonospora olivasterospora]|uniref:Uncharacterized protein n=1 Tax=Micromonospora olivasterospora TaxID=1880 RepID=A0A562I2Y9_MICOL|nr:hypothetical protein JD77_00356 [Micromonospora olivasterospora]
MAPAEFLVTRVVEVGVHGLDLAAALGREPWLTPAAAEVTGGRGVPAGLGWDGSTLVAEATGRAPLTGRKRAVLAAAGVRWLAFAAG